MLARRGDGPLPVWFQDWVTHGEQVAVRLRWFEPHVVPGLLENEAYARALLTGRIGNHAEDTEARVMARMDRQAVITREDGPAEFLAVIDEGVLRRAVGGAKVMAEQADHLVEAGGWPNVVIQVIPAATAVHDGLAGAGFAIADVEDGPGMGYQETALRGIPVTTLKTWRRWRWPSIGSGPRRCPGRHLRHYWRRRPDHGAKPSELAQGHLCTTNGGGCVEVATNLPGVVAVRDSKDPDGPVLTIEPGWAGQDFIADVKVGRHDLA